MGKHIQLISLILGLAVAVFAAEATGQEEPYLDFSEFQSVMNVEDIGFTDNLFLAGQAFVNAPSLQKLLPVYKYVVSTAECDNSSSRSRSHDQVDGLVLEWQIPIEEANSIVSDVVRALRLQDDEVEKIINVSKNVNGSDWISYGGFLAKLERKYNRDLPKNDLYSSGLVEALNSNQGRAAWVEGELSSGCDAANWARTGRFGSWQPVNSQRLELLVKEAYERSAQNGLQSEDNVLNEVTILFTVDPLEGIFENQEFIAECNWNRVLRGKTHSVCSDQLGLNQKLQSMLPDQ